MYSYELLARLRLLTLCEVNGEMQWMGTYTQWQNVEKEEQKIINQWEFNKIWK